MIKALYKCTTLLYFNVAKCNLGKVKIKPMLVAGCVCGVSG